MEHTTQSRPLPEKVMRRHAEMLEDLLPEFSRLVFEESRPADALLNSYLRAHREHGSRDRRFLSAALFSFFRWHGWTVGKLSLSTAEACLLGAALDAEELAESFHYLEAHCALPFNVEPIGWLSLEEKRQRMNEWFKDRPNFQRLEIADLVFPDFGDMVAPEHIEACVEAFQQRPPTWMRSRAEPTELVNALAKLNIPATVHSTVTDAVSVDGGVSLAHALQDQSGQFVVQDIASQCVALAAAPQQGSDWWDCCAGAGGKSMHLMDLMNQKGKVLATDMRIPALKELKKRARKYGIRGIRTQPFNAVHDEPFTKTFDGVMVDAPCSGWGTWSRNPDARWRASRRDVMQCATRQLKILSNAKWCVKPGGVLLYAVCTFTRRETEEVVMNFLDQYKEFSLEAFTHPLTGEETNGTLQLWPWQGPGDAMFIARFRRENGA